ncbi:MAG: hypothetical protein LBF65_01410 [Holosporales bacterium]|jgi:hypothetical protein|nr:hypothetical protein [Holosporales bacterium]
MQVTGVMAGDNPVNQRQAELVKFQQLGQNFVTDSVLKELRNFPKLEEQEGALENFEKALAAVRFGRAITTLSNIGLENQRAKYLLGNLVQTVKEYLNPNICYLGALLVVSKVAMTVCDGSKIGGVTGDNLSQKLNDLTMSAIREEQSRAP